MTCFQSRLTSDSWVMEPWNHKAIQPVNLYFSAYATKSGVGHPPQPKSDLSDLGRLKVPNSGKPEFGRGGIIECVARLVAPTAVHSAAWSAAGGSPSTELR